MEAGALLPLLTEDGVLGAHAVSQPAARQELKLELAPTQRLKTAEQIVLDHLHNHAARDLAAAGKNVLMELPIRLPAPLMRMGA